MFASESDKETHLQDSLQVFQFYRSNFDRLSLVGRITDENIEREMAGLLMVTKTRELLQTVALSRVLNFADKIILNPGTEPPPT